MLVCSFRLDVVLLNCDWFYRELGFSIMLICCIFGKVYCNKVICCMVGWFSMMVVIGLVILCCCVLNIECGNKFVSSGVCLMWLLVEVLVRLIKVGDLMLMMSFI